MSSRNYPVIKLTEEELEAFPVGTLIVDIFANIIARASAVNPEGVTEIKLPASLTRGYTSTPPTILVNKNSTGEDVYSRVWRVHQHIGPDPISLVDVEREIKAKFLPIADQAKTIEGDAAAKLVALLQEFQDKPNVTNDDCVRLVQELDALYVSNEMPSNAVRDYLKKGTEVRPELDALIKQDSLSSLMFSAGYLLESNLGLVGVKVVKDSDVEFDTKIGNPGEHMAAAIAREEASYRNNSISRDQAIANYRGIVEEVTARFEAGEWDDRVKELIRKASAGNTLDSAKWLARVIQSACEYSYGTKEELEAIRNGEGAALLARMELANWAQEIETKLLHAGKQIKYAAPDKVGIHADERLWEGPLGKRPGHTKA